MNALYRHSLSYEIVVLALYGRRYRSRQGVLAELVSERSSVLELCCGPATLYFSHLRKKQVHYAGLDISESFVARARRRGARAELRDLRNPEPLPEADHVLMQASLYQFLPDPHPIVGRMLAAAREQVIISEPIRNIASSRWTPVARLAQLATDSHADRHPARFTEQTLDRSMARYHQRLRTTFLVPGGREKVYVLTGALGERVSSETR